VSRDNVREHIKRWSQLHDQHRRDLETAKRDLAEAAKAEEQARRLADDAHRLRDEDRARRKGKRPLSAESIATAAVAIADAQGVEEVTMRKIAAVLGAGTMSLYHYLRTKEDLLAAMDDVIMGEILVSPKDLQGGWRKAMSAIARKTRDAYRRHPWALTIQTETAGPAMNGLRHTEQSLVALADTGLEFNDKLAIIIVLDDYVFGHSLRAAGSDFTDGLGKEGMDRIVAFMNNHVSRTDFPELHATMGEDSMETFVGKLSKAFSPDEWFETGLAVILDGLGERFGINSR
jgi:AcrR family transcriptional regulator